MAVTVIENLCTGLYAHVAVKLFPEFEGRDLHPGIVFPFALKCTFPATDPVETLKVLATLKTRLLELNVSVAEEAPVLIVTVVFDELTTR